MTAIEEGKDLNTLSIEDLISSLKCHEIDLNEHEPIKKPKSIALKSRGKSTKALKALESEEESTSEDSDKDPEIVQKMAMLSNRLQYLAKKNKRFLSRSSSQKSSRREEKGCFNCMKGCIIQKHSMLKNLCMSDLMTKSLEMKLQSRLILQVQKTLMIIQNLIRSCNSP